MTQPLRVGVVGAGPWSTNIHGPMFASHPRTELAGVWARRPEAAEAVAHATGSKAVGSFDELLAECDAVSFAVPPDVQAELAAIAAREGKALLLEKPLGLDVPEAEALAEVIAAEGVVHQLDLTWRYAAEVRSFLDRCARSAPLGGRAEFVTDAYLGGMFATPWRLRYGPLLDVGPHLIDLLDAALGPVTGIRAHGDPHRWVGLLLEHQTGAASEVSISSYAPFGSQADSGAPIRARTEVYTDAGPLEVDTSNVFDAATLTRVVDEFVDAIERGSPHSLDAAHGVRLQRLIAAAYSDLA